MNALVVGGVVAAVMAGPSLYGMVQNGQLDGTTAIGRGLLVAGICAGGASYVLGLVREYEKDRERKVKREELLAAVAEAAEAAERQADAAAAAAAAVENAQRKPS